VAAGEDAPRFRVEFTRPALKALADLPQKVQERIAPRIDALAVDPRPRGVEKLEGEDDLYRIRVGDYRVIYTIQDDRLIVVVVRVANRRDAYRRKGN
jgi:mRNA interferase RelE/StbE